VGSEAVATRRRPVARSGGVVVALALLLAAPASAQPPEPPLTPTPKANCGPGSRPESGMQGRVSPEDHASGRAAPGFTCNAEVVGAYRIPNAIGTVGGFKVERYVDAAGHDCAYYDTTLMWPTNALDQQGGVNVLDMTRPANPVLTARLVTPAMDTPHESLVLSKQRGLLAAVAGNLTTQVGVIDVYDISKDCRQPELRSSTPVALLGHESGMAPDGRTFYSASPGTQTLVPVDISNPSAPVPLGFGRYDSHGLSISDDGNRAYVAGTDSGLIILDSSQFQSRAPNPQFREIARLQWKSMSIPQNAIPVTIGGHPYVVEVDEFSVSESGSTTAHGSNVGAARIIDIADETNPRVVSNMRLEVHQAENRPAIANDPGAQNVVQGYAAHYCNVPKRVDPGIVACSMILSGLRVFDIRDPKRPREIAYFNAPVDPRVVPAGGVAPPPSNWAMSSPSFVPERGQIWYSDGLSGFYAVRLTNGVWPFPGGSEGDCLRPSQVAFKLHRKRGTRVVRVEAFVNGKRWLVRTGRDVKRIVLRGLKRTGKLQVRIVARHDTGARVVSTRTWDGCRKGRPRVRAIPAR
jgi:hypothetical protein